MSLAQLQQFVVVAEEGRVRSAARRLHLSQPPLTRSLRALEDELGTALFLRGPKGVQLTPAGTAFLPHARRVLATVEEARASVAPHTEGGVRP